MRAMISENPIRWTAPSTWPWFVHVLLILLTALSLKALRRWFKSKELSESTWSPFQSLEVREICAHLTPGERARLLDDARQRGRQIGQWIAVPFGIAFGSLVWSRRVGLLLLALFALYFACSGLPRLRAMRRRTSELLCQTEWALSRGYTPERLRLTTIPWLG